jgi:hypothetical protein
MLEVGAAIAARHDRTFTATELSADLGARLNLVTGALGRLEAVGLVTRTREAGRTKPYKASPSIYWQACKSLLNEARADPEVVLDLTGQEPVIELDAERAPETADMPPAMPSGYQSHIVTSGDLALQAIQLEYKVFTEANFFPKYPSGRVEDYDAYSACSLFHVVTNADDAVVGMVRSLIGPFSELPIGAYLDTPWENAPVDPVCEYASLAIAPEERGAGIAEELYRSVFALAWGSQATGLVALVDPWLRDLLNGFYGCNFEEIGPGIPFSYGEVIPIGVSLAALESHMPVSVPRFWAWLYTAIEDFEITLDIRDVVVASRSPRARPQHLGDSA